MIYIFTFLVGFILNLQVKASEDYVPPKTVFTRSVKTTLSREPLVWNGHDWEQPLSEAEKKNLFLDQGFDIIHHQKIEDNCHSDKHTLTIQDFEKYHYAELIGKNFLSQNINLKNIDMTNFSFVTEIGYGFLRGCINLKILDLSALIYLRKIGDNFLKDCRSIESIIFPKSKNKIILGDNFLYDCRGLTTLDLSGLSQVTSVGKYFLSGCSGLTTVNFTGLSQLTSVGKYFLSGCSGLTTVNFTGLSQLTSVGDYFLHDCRGLTKVDLSPLSQVISVGDRFLYDCRGLTKVDLSGLSRLTFVGDRFLEDCRGLTTVDLSPLSQVTSVGEGFLEDCRGLTTVDLSGLSQLTFVGDRFLEDCRGLTTVDLSPLSQVTSVGDSFLEDCRGLTTVDLSPLSQVTSVGNRFLSNCKAIRSVKFGEKTSKILIQKTVDFLRNSEIAEQQELGVKVYQHYLLELPQDLDAYLSQMNLPLLRDHVTAPLTDIPHLDDSTVLEGFKTIVMEAIPDEDLSDEAEVSPDKVLIKQYKRHLHPILQNLFEDSTRSVPWPMYPENREEMKIAFKHLLQNFQTLLKGQKGKEEVKSLLYVLLNGFEHCQSRQALELNSILSKMGLHLDNAPTTLYKLWHLINDYKLEAFNKFSAHQYGIGAHTQGSQFTVINNFIGLPVAMRSFNEKIGKLSEGMIKELLSTFIKEYFNPTLLVDALYQKSQVKKPLLESWDWRSLILEHLSEKEKQKDHNKLFKIISGVDQEDFNETISPITRREIRYLLGQIKLLESSQEEAIQEINRLMERLKPYEGTFTEFIDNQRDKEFLSSALITSSLCTEEIEYVYYEYETPEGYSQLLRRPKVSSGVLTEELGDLTQDKDPYEEIAQGLGVPVDRLEKTREMKEEEFREVEDIALPAVLYDLESSSSDIVPLNVPGRSDDQKKEVFGLSIDGGGVRGYIPASLLNELNKALHKTEWGADLALKDIYDCIGGTSIGGILALGIGTNVPTEDLLDLLENQRSTIFPQNNKSWIRQKVSQVYTCQYDTGPLEEMLQNTFGDLRLKEAQTDVFVTACSTDGHPYLLGSNLFTPIDFGDLEMWRAARATSAAPTYFQACDIKIPGIGEKSLVDGGIWTNNPSPYVLAELMRKHAVGFSHTHVLSLGTGNVPCTNISPNAGLWDVRGIVDAQFSSQQISSHLTTQSILGGKNYYRLSPNLRTEIRLDAVSEKSLKDLKVAAQSQLPDLQAYIKCYIGTSTDDRGLLGKEFRQRN